jgi:membrane protease YdiL (CAAX protease family)
MTGSEVPPSGMRGAGVAPSAVAGSGVPPSAVAGGVVVVGGLAFLLGRPAVGGLPLAVPVLAAGYLVMTAGSLAVRAAGRMASGGEDRPARARARRDQPAPLGWVGPLVLGIVAVIGAGMVGGPAPERRVGVVAVGLVVLAAVAEEALFRRVLYGWLERFGPVVAVVGSALVFALVHLPAYGVAAMPVDLGAALLLSWQRYASGRWTVPAVTHVVANLLAVT